MSVDKSKVRDDYQRGLSLRSIAAKYGIPKSTVSDWIKRYGWAQEGKQRSGVTIRVPKETASDSPDTSDTSGCPDVSSYHELITSYTLKLLKKADEILEISEALAPRDMKSISSMLLDARQLLDSMSPLEEEERRLRLEALRRQQEAEAKKDDVVIRFVETEGAEE